MGGIKNRTPHNKIRGVQEKNRWGTMLSGRGNGEARLMTHSRLKKTEGSGKSTISKSSYVNGGKRKSHVFT